jgi:exodeoxyribonuclease V beta subunit
VKAVALTRELPSLNLNKAIFTRNDLARERMLTSFSALMQGRHHEAPDYDREQAKLESEPLELQGIAAFPASAKTGLCWHSILEEWDFQSGATLTKWVQQGLQSYGFDASWGGLVEQMLLMLSQISFAGKPLATISWAHRISEMAFTFRIVPFKQAALVQILVKENLPVWAAAAARLQFETFKGFMAGFIDLIVEANGHYFVVDYKSNRLGATVAHYQSEAMIEAMATHHYYLQYLIYTVALHRYLMRILPNYDYDQHMGGIVYIFMRGLQPDSETGIFRDRPSRQLIEALDALFGH